MHYRIIIMSIKYSYMCNGFKYLMLYSIALIPYLLLYNDNFSKIVSIVLSSMAILATALSDKISIAQLMIAYHIVGLKKRNIALILLIFLEARALLLILIYTFLIRYIITLVELFIVSNMAIVYIVFSMFKEARI